MPPHQTPYQAAHQNQHELIERLYEETLAPPRRRADSSAVYGLLGLVILLAMLWIAVARWV